jgi:hypothetical protein
MPIKMGAINLIKMPVEMGTTILVKMPMKRMCHLIRLTFIIITVYTQGLNFLNYKKKYCIVEFNEFTRLKKFYI